MVTIWKYPLELTERQSIRLPQFSKILTAQVQNDAITLWLRVIPNEEMYVRQIYIIGTGNPIPSGAVNYIATIQLDGFVWHVFS